MRAPLVIGLLGLGCSMASGENPAAKAKPVTEDAPLVVELFTSQGCSSCPSADAIVNKLAKSGVLDGRKVIPLAFHVDYWDDLGWPDPFASAAWTERQREYADALGDDRVYTPELVVGGKTGMVGSHYMRIQQAGAAAPRQQRIAASGTWTTSALTVTATAPATASVYVALWQDGTSTKIPRGENAGETLAGEHIVRKLVLVAAPGKTETKTIKLDSTWRASGAVAFAQRTDRQIIGSALLPTP
jgi:hypothetical protein